MQEGVFPILSTSAVPGELPGGVTQTLTLKASEALTIMPFPGLTCYTGPHTIKSGRGTPSGPGRYETYFSRPAPCSSVPVSSREPLFLARWSLGTRSCNLTFKKTHPASLSESIAILGLGITRGSQICENGKYKVP